MDQKPLWERLKEARAFQIAVVYLGACWFVLQLVATLRELLSLPEWIGPVTILLLGLGLVIVAATAWVQSLPSTTAAEEAGARPTDWEVAPGDALRRIRKGELPHLTWGRAILGGVLAISLAIGAAGAYVLLSGGSALLEPRTAAAGGASSSIAVLPFQARGAEFELYGEGMVDLLSINLEGLEGMRAINSGTVIARWRSEVGRDLTVELAAALQVARGLDARYAVRGSVVPGGGRVRIVADVFDLVRRDIDPVASVQVEGGEDAVLDLVDQLTVDLARVFVGSRPESVSLEGAITTPSLPALEAYLRGEALYRRTRFEEAMEAFEQSAAADADFALAHWRLFSAVGWMPDLTAERSAELGNRLLSVADRLPPRHRVLARAATAVTGGRSDHVDALREHLARHPDDGEAWFWLHEYAFHTPWLSKSTEAERERAVERAVELEPTFGPYYLHLLAWLIGTGDERGFERRLAEYAETVTDGARVEPWPILWDFFRGSDAEMARAERLLRSSRNEDAAFSSLIAFTSDDLSPRMLLVHDMLPSDIANTFPGKLRGHDVAIGRRPLPPRAGDQGPWLSRVRWHLLVEEAQPLPPRMLAEGTSPSDAVHIALLAADEGARALRDQALTLVEPGALEARTTFLAFFHGAATRDQAVATTEALLLLRAGDAAGARRLMEDVVGDPQFDAVAMLLAGDACAALGDWAAAIGFWRTLMPTGYRPHVRLRLGRGHEALGDTDGAVEHYRGFLTMMSDPDPALQPLVDEAEQALARLGA